MFKVDLVAVNVSSFSESKHKFVQYKCQGCNRAHLILLLP